MGTAYYREGAYSVSGYNLPFNTAYIECDLADVSVDYIPGKVKDSGKYGINGTFFNRDTLDVIGIAIKNGQVVKEKYSQYNAIGQNFV
ncbi:hypothetical protein LJK88_45685 [Paenibacillus sp. P26]|nr:hypothetical protein LJK88_45685 [Paenibacillus sp. P26]UUZ92077.1 hypothetical protein LJK87_42680 [Paenibacillus sp. P25]